MSEIQERRPAIKRTEIESAIFQLETTSREMKSINVNFVAIKNETKDRWQSTVDEAVVLLNRVLGK